MACPYFYPIAKAEDVRQPARAPLGVLYHGRCEVGGAAEQEACNFGYGRYSCGAFPLNAEADAVRFTTLEGRILFVIEKDYLPVRHGDADSLDGVLGRQAQVFREWAAK